MGSSAKDVALALAIHERLNTFGVTENAIIPPATRDSYVPRTLVDNTLELIDPTPNIHTLFVQFNAKYFWNKLLPVEVKWSNRMTSCAGVCSFHPRNCQCIITLSVPLLKLRPRKDLVETLLHEMIHSYLFLTNNNRDRDGHGPEFHKHMYRINKEAGTNITVYHNFHDEVKLYQQHWWQCDGPCQTKSPYFGTVRRAMNRPPGPNDNWWLRHHQNCGGKFIKVREPDKKPPKSKKAPKDNDKGSKSKDISDWLTKTDKTKSSASSSKSEPSITTKTVEKTVPTTNKPSSFTKIGNNGNNIHGWGVGGPSVTPTRPAGSVGVVKSPKFHASGVLGGSGTGRSNLLDKFSPSMSVLAVGKSKKINRGVIVDLTQTPPKRKSEDLGGNQETGSKMAKHDKRIPENPKCPVCDKAVRIYEFNRHLDQCLMCESTGHGNVNRSTPKFTKKLGDLKTDSPKRSSAASVDSEDSKGSMCGSTGHSNVNRSTPKLTKKLGDVKTDSPKRSSAVSADSEDSKGSNGPLVVEERQKCLVCNDFICPGMTLNEHLESCIESAFTDESILELDDNDEYNENADGDERSKKKFPCPLCMTLIAESLMNQHLDQCLSADLLKNYIE